MPVLLVYLCKNVKFILVTITLIISCVCYVLPYGTNYFNNGHYTTRIYVPNENNCGDSARVHIHMDILRMHFNNIT